jgi:hypothetical protein
MQTIVLAFTDYWTGFNPQDNFFTKALSTKYNVVVVDPSENPDILIYSFFGYESLKYNCIKVYFTGENDVPNFNLCDYAISFNRLSFNDRHLRLPLYATHSSFDSLRYNKTTASKNPCERDFCSMVVSNANNRDGILFKFHKQLSQYKTIASGGRYANNVGGPIVNKLDFISRYKFNLAFENSSVDGYSTEKIVEPLACGTIPIYWGDALISKEINPDSFINIHDFNSLDRAIDYIKQVDSNDDLYLKHLNAPALINNPYVNYEELLLQFFDRIISSRKRYITDYGAMGYVNRQLLRKEKLFSHKYLRGGARLFRLI